MASDGIEDVVKSVEAKNDQKQNLGEKLKLLKKNNKKSMKKATSGNHNGGVIVVRHIPHGFYETQLKNYFQQFGEVKKLRLLRSKKTGRSKGFAFVEFENDEVARIVADAMKDYLMFRHRVMCKYIPREEVHPLTFRRGSQSFKKPIGHLLAIKKHNSTPTSLSAAKKSKTKLKLKNKKRINKLNMLGIDYELKDSANEN